MPREFRKNCSTSSPSLYFPKKKSKSLTKSLLIISSILAIGLMGTTSRADERRLAPEMPPISYSDAGEASGFAVDIAREVAARIKSPRGIEVMPIARAMATLTSEKSDIIIAIARTPEREKLLRWIVKIKTEPLVLLVKADSGLNISTIEKSKKLRIGVLRQGAAEQIAKRLNFAPLDISSDDISIARKLMVGRVDAWLTGIDVAMLTMDRAGYERSLLHAGPVLGSIDIYLAGSLGISDETAEKWKTAFNEMVRDGTYQKILNKYNFTK